jgi:hypothetical protein
MLRMHLVRSNNNNNNNNNNTMLTPHARQPAEAFWSTLNSLGMNWSSLPHPQPWYANPLNIQFFHICTHSRCITTNIARWLHFPVPHKRYIWYHGPGQCHFVQRRDNHQWHCNIALPAALSCSTDAVIFSQFPVVLRQDMQAIAATNKEVSTRIRGRHQPVLLHQVGIRCRHCAHTLSPINVAGEPDSIKRLKTCAPCICNAVHVPKCPIRSRRN